MLRNTNTVIMYVIMFLVCRFKAPGGGFRNLKFDPLYLIAEPAECYDRYAMIVT